VLCLAEDLYAFLVSANRDRLGPFFRYPYIPADRMDCVFDKRAMYRAAEAAGLRVPPTLYAPFDGHALSGWEYYPALVKPLVSRFRLENGRVTSGPAFPAVFGGKALLAQDRPQLERIAREVESRGIPFCVQRWIPGENPAIVNAKFVADRDGRIPACFISRKIRQQPADFGTCCVAESTREPELQRYAEMFCRATGYCGPGGMEFKTEPGAGTHWFIEVNPRLDFWIRMATLKGVNLPLQHYLLSLGHPLPTLRQTDDGARWIDIEGDIRGYRWRRRHPQYRISLRQWLQPYRSFDEAVWNREDPVPGFARFVRMIPSLIARP
jgi:predicted ATP-grasp superfamily ATP-dependent carboligase